MVREVIASTKSATPEPFTDKSFVVGDSPAILDVNAKLVRNATEGYIINGGPGEFTVAFSTDGEVFGGENPLEGNEILTFEDISVNKLRITHGGVDSSYRVSVI